MGSNPLWTHPPPSAWCEVNGCCSWAWKATAEVDVVVPTAHALLNEGVLPYAVQLCFNPCAFSRHTLAVGMVGRYAWVSCAYAISLCSSDRPAPVTNTLVASGGHYSFGTTGPRSDIASSEAASNPGPGAYVTVDSALCS